MLKINTVQFEDRVSHFELDFIWSYDWKSVTDSLESEWMLDTQNMQHKHE